MARGLRIAQLVESLDVGGLERMAIELGGAFRARGHESAMLCLFVPGALAGTARELGLSVEALGKPDGFSPPTMARLAGRLRAWRPDVLLTHNVGAHAYGAPAGWAARVPAIVSVRHGFISSQGRPYRETLFRRLVPLTSAVVSVSRHTERHFLAHGIVPPAKSVVIYNGIDQAPFARAAEPPAPRDTVEFGSIGRMVSVKGHSTLLGAFSRVVSRYPAARLRVVGGGPLAEELQRRVVDLGVGGQVRLEGVSSDVAAVLADLDVFVLSSTNEGLPIVILEAMAAGLPIVSTRVGGVPEVAPAGEVAWYCEPGDEASMAEALLAAATAGDRRVRGLRARELAATHHTLDAMAESYLALFRRILEARGG